MGLEISVGKNKVLVVTKDQRSFGERSEWRGTRYRKTKKPKNRDVTYNVRFLLMHVYTCIQIHLTLPNLIKPNLKLTKIKVKFGLLT